MGDCNAELVIVAARARDPRERARGNIINLSVFLSRSLMRRGSSIIIVTIITDRKIAKEICGGGGKGRREEDLAFLHNSPDLKNRRRHTKVSCTRILLRVVPSLSSTSACSFLCFQESQPRRTFTVCSSRGGRERAWIRLARLDYFSPVWKRLSILFRSIIFRLNR